MSDRPRYSGEHQTSPYSIRKLPPLAVLEWQPVASVHGSGSMLVGPHDIGAQALVPPAVITRAPLSFLQSHSEDERWRLAVWSWEDIEHSHVSAAPVSLESITLLAAIELVRDVAPHHLPWLEKQIELRAQCVSVLLNNYVDGEAAELNALRAELDDLMLDCTASFGGPWARDLATSL